MADPIGLISAGGAGEMPSRVARPDASEEGSFKEVLMKNLEKVNELHQDATQHMEDLAAGKTQDLESVILATEKADMAFKMLQSVRNKVIAAYEELK
ncbi:MAG: flagellar hook-basal body complex protein FliE, partial [Phycisphaerales bacterium]|nr:flagellar hook-basal body complex protein FliE [Phycisphaerales bacterium]